MGQTRYPDELRERATRTGVGGAGRFGAGQGCDPQDSARSWVSIPRFYGSGSRRPRSTRAPGPAPPPTRQRVSDCLCEGCDLSLEEMRL